MDPSSLDTSASSNAGASSCGVHELRHWVAIFDDMLDGMWLPFRFTVSILKCDAYLDSSKTYFVKPFLYAASKSFTRKMATSVLFVCLGNICRSPAAEGVFSAVVAGKGSAEAARFRIDSCGTGGGNPGWYAPGGWSYHEGDRADSRMRKEATKRGYDLTSRSRPLTLKDVEEFDYIICMDDANCEAVLEAADAWGGADAKVLAKQKVTGWTTVSRCDQLCSSGRLMGDVWYRCP